MIGQQLKQILEQRGMTRYMLAQEYFKRVKDGGGHIERKTAYARVCSIWGESVPKSITLANEVLASIGMELRIVPKRSRHKETKND